MHLTNPLLLAAATATSISAQGWSLTALEACGGDHWYLADKVAGGWGCTEVYGKNPDGEYPPEGTEFSVIYWTGAEICEPVAGLCRPPSLQQVVFYSDKDCTERTQSWTDAAFCVDLMPESLYFNVVKNPDL